VIKVNAPSSELTPLELGDSSAVQVGDEVVAIGSPLGLNETVTSGIVSALHRTITSPNNFSINDAIQTDAAINHGNSGGPLLDLQGQVIGINSQIESDSGGNDGIGFAVPSNTVKSVVSQLLADRQGRARIPRCRHRHDHRRPGLPARPAGRRGSHAGDLRLARPLTPASRRPTRRPSSAGRSSRPAATSSPRSNGKPVSTSEELQSVIGAMKPGDSASITYSRDGSRAHRPGDARNASFLAPSRR
jgi:putative serine protease PepD